MLVWKYLWMVSQRHSHINMTLGEGANSPKKVLPTQSASGISDHWNVRNRKAESLAIQIEANEQHKVTV